MSKKDPPVGKGVRLLNLDDHLPDAEILINQAIYDLAEVCKGKKVVDIGCGYGRNRKLVESVGGEWVGVEPFEGGAHTVTASAEDASSAMPPTWNASTRSPIRTFLSRPWSITRTSTG